MVRAEGGDGVVARRMAEFGLGDFLQVTLRIEIGAADGGEQRLDKAAHGVEA